MVGLVSPLWLDGLVYEIDSCGFFVTLAPFVRRVLVVSLSKQTLTCQTN